MNKTIKVVELFSGIGSQAKALENIGANFETLNTCEWDIHALVAYDLIHNNRPMQSDILEMSRLDILNELSKYKLSADFKNDISDKYLHSLPTDTLRQILSSIINTGNFINVKDLKGDMLPNGLDILTYSFPCQDLSNVGAFHGYNKGIDRDANNRSGLLWEVERMLKERVKINLDLPKVLILENVATLLAERHKKNFNEWKEILSNLGYYNKVYRLNSRNFGSAQNRERLIMISVLKNGQLSDGLLDKYFKNHNLEDDNYVNTLQIRKQGLKDVLKIDYGNYKYLEEALLSQPNDTKSRRDIWGKNVKLIDEKGNYNPRDFVSTLTTKQDRHPNSGNIYFNLNNKKSKFRYLTPRECFLCMGFDENDYEKVKSSKLLSRGNSDFFTRDVLIHLAGNSIVVNVLEQIFTQVQDILNLYK